MESATHPERPAKGAGNGASAGDATATESFEVNRPIDGSVIERVSIDSPAQVAAVVARVRANQPGWEAIGFAGRRRWLEGLRDWILANQDRIDELMQEETGKVRADADARGLLLPRRDQLLVRSGPEVPRRRDGLARTTRC